LAHDEDEVLGPGLRITLAARSNKLNPVQLRQDSAGHSSSREPSNKWFFCARPLAFRQETNANGQMCWKPAQTAK